MHWCLRDVMKRCRDYGLVRLGNFRRTVVVPAASGYAPAKSGREFHMNKVRTVTVAVVGFVLGVVVMAFGSRANAQRVVNSAVELNARFVVGQEEASSGGRYWIRFIRDQRTGDCYIVARTTDAGGATPLTKTDDNACDGL